MAKRKCQNCGEHFNEINSSKQLHETFKICIVCAEEYCPRCGNKEKNMHWDCNFESENEEIQEKNPKGIYPPKGGWEEQTWYLVEVSCRLGNPIHRSLFYSGFLDSEGNPAGYSGALAANYADDERPLKLHQLRYLKVIRVLLTKEEVDN